MPHDVTMPQLGMAQDAGRIVSWFKAPGDPVNKGDALFEVETDKATMEVEAQSDGFLTGVTAKEGDDVPVGEIIARISENADDAPPDTPTSEAKSEETEALPSGTSVTMPQLGMAQDTGLLVSWQAAPGDAVKADDILFEVETDKSTMEVPAGVDGFLAATLAEAGEEVAVGDPVAIISNEKPEAPVARSAARKPEQSVAPTTPLPAASPPAAKSAEKPPAPSISNIEGRILASPKTRRIALEQGLDLERLVAAGHPQPYHMRDLETLKALPAEAASQRSHATNARRLTAELTREGFSDFAGWAAQHAGLQDTNALLAGLAAAGLDRDTATVAVESFGRTAIYSVPGGPLGNITPAEPDARPDLRLRDLRMSRIATVTLGPEEVPVLTLAASGDGLSITLECAEHHLGATEAVALLSNFAGRMEQPLRHLL